MEATPLGDEGDIFLFVVEEGGAVEVDQITGIQVEERSLENGIVCFIVQTVNQTKEKERGKCCGN